MFYPISPSLGNSLVNPGDSDYSSIDIATVSRMPRCPKGYFYKIGEYETSTFYHEFLSDELKWMYGHVEGHSLAYVS